MSSNTDIKECFQHLFELSDYQDSDATIRIFSYSILSPSSNKKFLLEILMEQMKALVTERHDFDKNMNQNISTFWKFSENQDSDGRNKTKDFPREISCTRENLPTET